VPTLNDLPIQTAEIEIPFRRNWSGIFKTTDAAAPTEGERVEFVMGSLSLIGTVLSSEAFGGIAELLVVGGAGGWRMVPQIQQDGLSDQNDAIISASHVAPRLAASVGETVEVAAQSLGVHWTFDPTVSAANNLDAIGPWYMREDGVTVLGERADGAEIRATIESMNGARGRATCVIDEEDAASFLPGSLVASGALATPIRVKHTRYLVTPGRLSVEVSRREQTPSRLVDNVAGGKRFLGTYVYRIIEQVADRLNLQVVESTKGLPSQVLVDKAHGIPGVLSQARGSGNVLVVFGDGDRSRPFVTAYLGDAETVTMTATTITMTTSVALPTPEPVALAPAVDAINAALTSFCATITAAPNPAAAALLLQGAAVTLAGSIAAITRTGSIVAEAQ